MAVHVNPCLSIRVRQRGKVALSISKPGIVPSHLHPDLAKRTIPPSVGGNVSQIVLVAQLLINTPESFTELRGGEWKEGFTTSGFGQLLKRVVPFMIDVSTKTRGADIDQEVWTTRELIRKAGIVAAGCAKRGKSEEADQYREMIRAYS